MTIAITVVLLLGSLSSALAAGISFSGRHLIQGFFFIAVGILMLLAASKVPA